MPRCKLLKEINQEIEQYTLNLMESMELAGKESVPSSGSACSGNRKNKITGWNEHVKPYVDLFVYFKVESTFFKKLIFQRISFFL